MPAFPPSPTPTHTHECGCTSRRDGKHVEMSLCAEHAAMAFEPLQVSPGYRVTEVLDEPPEDIAKAKAEGRWRCG